MYYASVGSQLHMASSTSTVQNPTQACGYYSGMWGTCSNWGVNGNYSLYSAWKQDTDPKLNTTQTGTTNISMNTGYRYKDRMFHVNLAMSGGGSSLSTISFTSPFIAQSAMGTSIAAYKNQSMSNTQNFITTSALAAYGYQFLGWRLENAFVTVLTTTATVNWFYNSTYGGKAFAYIHTIHGAFGIIKSSDRRLKENIRLIGRSLSGINIYTWTYKNQEKHGKGVFQGVIAQEVPQASIMHPDGYLMVDYSKIDVTFKKVYGSIMGN